MSETEIGRQVRAAREESGLTQTDVAREMKDAGFGWHQQTVQRVETGARPLRFSEAQKLSELIGFNAAPDVVREGRARRLLAHIVDILDGEPVEEEPAFPPVTVTTLRDRGLLGDVP